MHINPAAVAIYIVHVRFGWGRTLNQACVCPCVSRIDLDTCYMLGKACFGSNQPAHSFSGAKVAFFFERAIFEESWSSAAPAQRFLDVSRCFLAPARLTISATLSWREPKKVSQGPGKKVCVRVQACEDANERAFVKKEENLQYEKRCVKHMLLLG